MDHFHLPSLAQVIALLIVASAVESGASGVEPCSAAEDPSREAITKLITQWATALRSNDGEPFAEYGKQLQGLGVAAIPALISHIEAEKAKDNSDPLMIYGALVPFDRLGPRARSAIPTIESLLKVDGSSLTTASLICLQKIDPNWASANIGKLLELLKSDDAEIRKQVIFTLASVSAKAASEAAAALVAVIENDPRGSCRREAINSLVNVAPESPVTARVLIAGLDDETIQSSAIESLPVIGARATPAIAKLVDLLAKTKHHQNGHPAESIIRTFGRLGANATPAVNLLVEILHAERDMTGTEPYLADRAAAALGSIGRSIVERIASLERQAGDENQDTRQQTVEIERLQAARNEIVAGLTKAIEIVQPHEQEAVVSAIGWIGRDAAPAGPALMRLLSTDEPKLRVECAAALVRIGKVTDEIVDLLKEIAVQRPSAERTVPGEVRVAILALGEAGPRSDDTAATLINALQIEGSGAQNAAAHALANLGLHTPEVISALRAAANHQRHDISAAAKEALERLEKHSPYPQEVEMKDRSK